MKFNARNLVPLGFKYTGLFQRSNAIGLFYRVRDNLIQYVSSYTPETLGVFQLTPYEMKLFLAGKASAVPSGCCSPASKGHTITDAKVLHTGIVKNAKQLEEIFLKHETACH